MIIYPVFRSEAARQSLSCKLSAWYDFAPTVAWPGVSNDPFAIVGRCAFPTPGFSVTLRPHIPRSHDPKTLLLDAIVHAPTGPVAQVPTEVEVIYPQPGSPPPPKTGTLYERVVILPDHLVLTVGPSSH